MNALKIGPDLLAQCQANRATLLKENAELRAEVESLKDKVAGWQKEARELRSIALATVEDERDNARAEVESLHVELRAALAALAKNGGAQ